MTTGRAQGADYEVWLYGSRARGDADRRSDTDLLVIGDDASGLAAVSCACPGPEPHVSFYTWHEVADLQSYGSLFLHHIRLEAVRICGSRRYPARFPQLLASLPPFTRAGVDLTNFRVAFEECSTSLAQGGWPDLEFQILATVARHAAILASHCIGHSTFGRTKPFHVWGRHAGWRRADVDALAAGSVAYRFLPLGADEWTAHELTTHAWLALLDRLLREMEVPIAQHEATLRAPA